MPTTKDSANTVTVITTHPSSGSERASSSDGADVQGNDCVSGSGSGSKDASDIPCVLLLAEDSSLGLPYAATDADDAAAGALDIFGHQQLQQQQQQLAVDDAMDRCSVGSRSSCMSPTSSAGGVYSVRFPFSICQFGCYVSVIQFSFIPPLGTDGTVGEFRPELAPHRQGRAALRPQLLLLHARQSGPLEEHHVHVMVQSLKIYIYRYE